ncbi:YqgQ family protein [Staphylococcus sp. ACRSN]|uniref:YqgQ family protein n=1 Tax=Staphylococcus sp. ACRSN TaxID=2918214 RepID=UPI001EF24EF1|nr:YqgQ family protein [Staphylococcus sp. ACRSN]MCG7338616.1 YqgQ family protein [Staphylococcus sp. ACRSN]
MNHKISTFYDVQQLLKKFGFIIYFKDKNDMYEMMEQEIHSLFQYKLISKEEYLKSRLIINQRRNE